MYIPEQIKAVRKKAGLTQAEAAELIGYSKRAWQDWEQGRKPMRDAAMDFFLLKLALRDAGMEDVPGSEEHEERLKAHEHPSDGTITCGPEEQHGLEGQEEASSEEDSSESRDRWQEIREQGEWDERNIL